MPLPSWEVGWGGAECSKLLITWMAFSAIRAHPEAIQTPPPAPPPTPQEPTQDRKGLLSNNADPLITQGTPRVLGALCQDLETKPRCISYYTPAPIEVSSLMNSDKCGSSCNQHPRKIWNISITCSRSLVPPGGSFSPSFLPHPQATITPLSDTMDFPF